VADTHIGARKDRQHEESRVEIKQKVQLKKKGDEGFVAVKQLLVQLKWTASVDLDLMAFYKAKDGSVGAVFSSQYPGGSMGDLNEAPFIMLDQDAAVGGSGGDHVETLRITKLDHIAELHIIALNYTDASAQRSVNFATYDGNVTVLQDNGAALEVPLSSDTSGHVAHVCTIDNSSPMGAKLVNVNNVLSLQEFVSTVPGARALVS
jgi:tellurite resistance protein TerA